MYIGKGEVISKASHIRSKLCEGGCFAFFYNHVCMYMVIETFEALEDMLVKYNKMMNLQVKADNEKTNAYTQAKREYELASGDYFRAYMDFLSMVYDNVVIERILKKAA